MKRLITYSILLFSALLSYAQEKTPTIKVKKVSANYTCTLDSTFTHLVVFDVDHQKVDSCIVTFNMLVEVPGDGYRELANGERIQTVYPVSYRSHSAYLTPEMKKAWKNNPSKQTVFFQKIYGEGKNKKAFKIPDFSFRKP